MDIKDYFCSKQEIDFEQLFKMENWQDFIMIDYIKGLKHAFSCDNEEDYKQTIKEIYNASRICIPNTLYKYNSLTGDENMNNLKLKTLADNLVYLSEISEFNDPFDNKVYYFDIKRLEEFNNWKPKEDNVIFNLSSKLRICCFTENGVNSMPMWAHYANNHSGYCVEYNMMENSKMRPFIFPVQYTDKRVEITSIFLKHFSKINEMIEKKVDEKVILEYISTFSYKLVDVICYFVNIKHYSWEYEKEFRCSIENKNKYITANPTAIYIGKNCKEMYKNKLIEIAINKRIPIYQMCFDNNNESFELKTIKLN